MASGDLSGAIDAFRAGVAIEDQNNYTEPLTGLSRCAIIWALSCCLLDKQNKLRQFIEEIYVGIKTMDGRCSDFDKR